MHITIHITIHTHKAPLLVPREGVAAVVAVALRLAPGGRKLIPTPGSCPEFMRLLPSFPASARPSSARFLPIFQ